MANTFELISSVTVGSGGAASIDFTSIPATYTDLVLKLSLRTDQSSGNGWVDCRFKFNSSTSSLSEKFIFGSGSAVASYSTSGEPGNIWASFAAASTNTSNTFSSGEIYMPNYAGSSYKSYSSDSVTENNAISAMASLDAGLWSNTSAINQITISPYGSGNYVQYTTAYLYGVKNA